MATTILQPKINAQLSSTSRNQGTYHAMLSIRSGIPIWDKSLQTLDDWLQTSQTNPTIRGKIITGLQRQNKAKSTLANSLQSDGAQE